MKRIFRRIALCIALVQAISCAGQNIVPNPSFEQYNTCPNGISGLNYSPAYNNFPTVHAWVSPLQQASADYFNSCAPFSAHISTPSNAFGHQLPHSGNGYVGIIAWEGNNQSGTMTNVFAEYIQCKLTQAMAAGTRYCVNFYVSTGVSGAAFNFVGIDEIGINFSSAKTSQATGYTMSMPLSVTNPPGNFLDDTTNWKKITTTYTATGGEEWLTLGWFDNGAVPAQRLITPQVANPAFKYRCYLFIDDITVTPIRNTDTVFSRKDTLHCSNKGPVTIKSSVDMADYSWSNGATTDRVQAADSGIYWCVSNTGCAIHVDTFVIKYEPIPILNIGKEVINCKNEPVTLASNVQANDYTWSTGENANTITVNKTGVYKLSVTGKCGVQTDSVKVYIQPPTPPPAAVDTSVCQFADNILINIKDTAIKWYTVAEGNIGTKQQPAIVTQYTGRYNLFVTTTSGKCESEKVPVNVNIRYTPHEELGDKEIMCDNDLQVIGKMETDVTYKWNTGANACCVLPEKEGLYKRSANNDCGSYIDSIWIYHKSCEECIVFPNAFIPVKGNANNIFRPLLKCPVTDFHIRIFNRWGNLVYESDDVHQGWNGRHNYDWAMMGTYVYIVEYKGKGKLQPQVMRGNVMLLR